MRLNKSTSHAVRILIDCAKAEGRLIKVAEISERLSGYRVDECLDSTPRRAAIAAIFRQQHDQPEILFIKRADKLGDPWSGQMAFPGGHIGPDDPSPRHRGRGTTSR